MDALFEQKLLKQMQLAVTFEMLNMHGARQASLEPGNVTQKVFCRSNHSGSVRAPSGILLTLLILSRCLTGLLGWTLCQQQTRGTCVVADVMESQAAFRFVSVSVCKCMWEREREKERSDGKTEWECECESKLRGTLDMTVWRGEGGTICHCLFFGRRPSEV